MQAEQSVPTASVAPMVAQSGSGFGAAAPPGAGGTGDVDKRIRNLRKVKSNPVI